MRSTWLAMFVLSAVAVLAKAEDSCGSGYELIICILETMQSNSKALENNLKTITATVDQLVKDQHLFKSTMQNYSNNMEQWSNSLKSTAEKAFTLAVTVAGEPRCPENAADEVYNLKPVYSSIPAFPVYCENGWIVIHRRFNGSLDFNRKWGPYREGFGDLQGEHWMGLEKMHQITRVGSYELKVVLKSFDGVVKTAKFEGFKIGSETEQYQLNLEKFVEGDAGDSLMHHNTMKFATMDRGDSDDCTPYSKSGWWFRSCYQANLNAMYMEGDESGLMSWFAFNKNHECLKEARMMIRAKEPEK